MSMQKFARIAAVACALGVAAGCGAGIAQAQDIDAGKSPAQLFASHCAACHRGPQGLAAGQSVWAVAGFLVQHYTADRASAGQLANYLVSVGGERRNATRPGTAAGRPEAAPPRDGRSERPKTGRRGAARGKAAASRQRKARQSAQPPAASPDTPSVIISTQPHAVTPGSRPLHRPRRPVARKPPAAAE